MKAHLQGVERRRSVDGKDEFSVEDEGARGKRSKVRTTSGKNRDRDFPDFALISTASPDLNARQRNPSHFGSNCQPGPFGSFGAILASIGSSDNGTPSKSGLQRAPR